MGKAKLYWLAGGLGLLAAFYAMAKHAANTSTTAPTATGNDATGGSGGGGATGLAGLPVTKPPPGFNGTNALMGGSASGGFWDASPPTIVPIGVPPPSGHIFGNPPPKVVAA